MDFIKRQQDYQNKNSLAYKFRAARSRHVRNIIERVCIDRGSCQIIDLGGRVSYWNFVGREFLSVNNCHVTIVNNESINPIEDDIFKISNSDLFDIKYSEGQYDLCHSNSVIEHVGDWGGMEEFARITRTIGRTYYVQTPYFWFPIEPHYSSPFFHWLPEGVRAARLLARDHGFQGRLDTIGDAMRSVQHARLLDRKMMTGLFPDATFVEETFMGLTKSLMAIRA